MYRLLESVTEGCPGHGPAHLLVESAAEIGFQWDSRQLGWERLGLPVLSNLAGPIQHFWAAVLEAWMGKGTADLCVRKGFREGPWLDIHGTLQLLNSAHVRERDTGSAQGCPCWWSLEWLSAATVKGQHVPCRFCGGADGDGHLFWDCAFPPLVEILENPDFHCLKEMDKSHWPRCFLWHGWLPLLSGANGGSPWAENPAEGAGNLLECTLGSYTLGLLSEWQVPVGFDAKGAAGRVPDEPDVWTDGSLVQDKVSGACSSGSGFFNHLSGLFRARP